jgi:small conductance mechanosensitive channel
MRSALLLALLVATAPTLPAWGQDAVEPPQTSDLQELAEELRRATARIDEVEANLQGATAAHRTFFEFQRRQRWQEHHEALRELAESIETDPADADSATVALAASALQRELEIGQAWIRQVEAEVLDQINRLAESSAENLVEAEIELTRLNEGLDLVFTAVSRDFELAPALGLDLSVEAAAHDSAVAERAELLGASLEFAADQAATHRGWLDKPGVDTAAVRLRIAAAEERIAGSTASLHAMTDLMEERGFPVAHYRRLIVANSGEIDTQLLDREVLGGLLSDWARAATDWIRGNLGGFLVRLFLILVVLLLAMRLAGWTRRGADRWVQRLQLSSLIQNLIVSGASKAVWLVALFSILAILGVDLGPMLAGLGIAGFVLGFALQETLANFASGVMIMVYRPFDVGDFVTIGGVTGNVKDLTPVSTVIQTLDNRRIIVPNGKVWGDVINNATAEKIRRVDLVFGISYGDDVDHARRVLEDVLAHEERVLDDPAPMVRVGELGDSSVNLLCRPWCRTEDYWDLMWDLTGAVKKRFDAEGITIPFPQRDVHLHGTAAAD